MNQGRYRLRDIPDLLRTPLGRIQFFHGIYYRLWPLLSRLARTYRRTWVSNTRIVAVVGSFGKTTTTRAATTALQRPIYPKSYLNCWSYVAGAIFRIRRRDHHAVLEVGINDTEQMRQYAQMIQPDVTVVTSIGSEHHRSLGSLDTTRNEKVEMVRALSADGLAILNGDDENVMWMASQTQARIVTFGFQASNDVRASELILDWPHGMKFLLHVDSKTHPVSTMLYGRHMVYTLLAAIAVAMAEGLPLEQILASLQTMPPTPGRLQTQQLDGDILLLRDDYKSTLETVQAALDVFADTPAARRIVVMGEVSEPPGSQGPIYRELGNRIATMADLAVFVGGNFQRYAAGARQGGMENRALFDAKGSVLEAAAILCRELKPGDSVLLKGRDTQRLERVMLALTGRQVKCDIGFCDTRVVSCEECPMLERGWQGKRVVI
ncbi:MAG: UDP-N-acetylmuramoyl-tripeptide--D-alanyl-D-alanine ligase [Pirellulaceae bacterium]|nr:UDP-N-acetylmuramoyl-tripeptide--D-alanyl-D-alanine ligase [Pirellulaceae bacterium]